MKNTIDAVNGVLTKANDLRYFVLLGTLILFLDSSLIFYKDYALVDLKASDLKDDITIGSILIFVCFFCLFVSFVVGSMKIFISGIFQLVPYNWISFLHSSEHSEIDYDNFISSSDLKKYSIVNNNQVAYNAYLDWKNRKSDGLLEHYSLAFLLASLLNLLAWMQSEDAVLNILFSIDSGASILSADTLVLTLSTLLYMALFYLGVIVGCGLKYDRLEDYIFLYRHGIHKS